MTSNEHGSAAPNSSQQALGESDLNSSASPTSSSALLSTDISHGLPLGTSSVKTTQSSIRVGDLKALSPSVTTLRVSDTADITTVPSYTSQPTTPLVKAKSRSKPQVSTVKKAVIIQPVSKVATRETEVDQTSPSSSVKLPPAASLSAPRTWSGFQNQDTPYQILPQVTSLATPSRQAPFFFNPSTVLNWQLSFPTGGGLPTVAAFTPSVSFAQPSEGIWTPSFVTVNPSGTEDNPNPWTTGPSFVTTTPSASVPTLGVNSEGLFQVNPESFSNFIPKETSGSTFIVSPATLNDLSPDNQTMGKTASSTAEAVEGKDARKTASKKKKTDETESKPSTSRSTSKETTDEKPQTTKKDKTKDTTLNRGRRSKTPKLEFFDGEKCEASDAITNTWYKSKFVCIDHKEGKVKVHFEGWNGRYDEWIPMHSSRLRPMTGEKFSERPESYSIGDFAITNVSKQTQVGLVIEVLKENKYVVLFHDGTRKTATTKGLRRMSPQMREKHADDLERLTELKKAHPSFQANSETEQIADETSAESDSAYAFDEVDGGSVEPATTESDPNMPSTSGMSAVKKTGKKPGRPPAVPGASPPELLITSSSKPKRQPKKPSKFNDSILIGNRKKRKTKSDADETPASGTQTPEPVEDFSAEVEKEPVLVTPSSASSGSKKNIPILHASPIKLSKDEAESSSMVVPLNSGHSSARTSLERASLPKMDIAALSKEKSESNITLIHPAKKASSSKSSKKSVELETAKETDAEVETKLEKITAKKLEKKSVTSSQSMPARRSLLKEMPMDDEPTSDQIEAEIQLDTLNAKKARKKQKVEAEVGDKNTLSGPSTSAGLGVGEGAMPVVKKRSGRPKTIKNLIEASAEDGDWVPEEGSVGSSRSKKPKILAPKELIIRLDHNEFKCNVAECQKSFRKQQLLESHLKHYHQLSGSGGIVEPAEEEKVVEPAAVNRKKKPSTSSLGEGDDGAATLGMLLSALQPVLPSEPGTKSTKLVTAMQHVVIPRLTPKSPIKEVPKEIVQEEVSIPKSPERKSPKKLHDVLQSPAKPASPIKPEEKPVVMDEKMPPVENEGGEKVDEEVMGEPELPKKKKKTKRDKSSSGHHVEERRSKKESSSRRQSFKKRKTSSRDSMGMEAAFGKMGLTPDVGGRWKAETSSRSKVRRNEYRDDSETEEVNQYIQNDHELVHCSCGYEMENGFMIQCELCATWQHGHCYGIELESEVPKHYVCDFCRAPKSVRYSQREACHDLQFLRAGRLPVFTPLDEDEPLLVQNKELYQSLVDDTLYCNDQIRTLRKVGRSLIAAQEAHTKNGLFLSSICKTHAEKVKLSNALKNIPESALENLNLEELLEKLVVNNGEATEEHVLDGSDISLPVFSMNGLPQDFSPVSEAHSTVTHRGSTVPSSFSIGELLKDSLSFPEELPEFGPSGNLSNDPSMVASASSDNLGEADQSMDISELEEYIAPKEIVQSPDRLSEDGSEELKSQPRPSVPMYFAQTDFSLPSTSTLEVPVSVPLIPERVESPEFAVIPPRPRNQLNNGKNTFKSLVNGLPGADTDPQSPEVYPFTPPSWSPRVASRSEGPEDDSGLNGSGSSVEIPSPEKSFEVPLPEVSGPPTATPAFVMTDIDPEVMALCLEGNLPAILKACNNREDALEKYLDDLEAHMLEMEKACDERYGTMFATTPQDAEKDHAELQRKLSSYQTDLRNLERLGSVVAVKPKERPPRDLPVPLPVPAPASTSRANVTVNDILRPPLPVVIKLNKDGKPRKNAAGLKTSPTTTPAKKVKEPGTAKATGKVVNKRSESPRSPVPTSAKVSSEVPKAV